MNVDPNTTEWKVGIPLMILEYPNHVELAHLSQRIADIIIIQLLANNNGEKNEFKRFN
mgnify:CR=1 FL=1|tara:strand:+ start:126 stop:299 length:174 start_codon:yes stop_codon:yes gene_type:complete